MNYNANRPSITAPLQTAWNSMLDQLFHPFDLNRWIFLGFTAWLARVGEGGGRFDTSLSHEDRANFHSFAHELWAEHAHLILAILVPLLLLMLALGIALTWVRCRGNFVFLDNVVTKNSAVVAPWQHTRIIGQALFRWTLVYALCALLALLLALAPLLWLGFQSRQGLPVSMPLMLGLSIPLLLLWVLAIVLIDVLLNDFVVPLMARHQETTGAAWRRLGHLLRNHLGTVVGYLALRAALSAAAMALIFIGGCLTCCCLFVLLMVPVVWAVVALPWLLFIRLYSLEFLRQFGPDFDLWSLSEPPRLPPGMPPEATATSNSSP